MKNEEEEMIKRFDEKCMNGDFGSGIDVKEMQAFILQERQRAIEGTLEAVEGMAIFLTDEKGRKSSPLKIDQQVWSDYKKRALKSRIIKGGKSDE